MNAATTGYLSSSQRQRWGQHDHAHSSHHNVLANAHEGHENGHPLSHKIIFWGGLAALGLVIAPHLLPAIGIGEGVADFVGPVCFPGDPAGSGAAGWVGNFLKDTVPFIGEELAKGGWVTALTSASVGIGGVLLGNFIGKREDESRFIKWGTVIKVAALATSFFVSLPALLPALAMGISFMGGLGLQGAESLFGMDAIEASTMRNDLVNNVVDFVGTAPASTGGISSGLSSTSTIWAHLVTCGGTVGALNFASKKAVEPVHSPSHSMTLPDAYASKQPASNTLSDTMAAPTTKVHDAVHHEKLSPQLSAKLAAIA